MRKHKQFGLGAERRGRRWWSITAAACLAALLTAGVANHVDKQVTPDDMAALARFGVTAGPAPGSYAEELQRIGDIQQRVLQVVRVSNATPPQGHPIEPDELLRRGYGACYEISRTLEKAFALNGLQSRRVFHLYRQDKHFLSALWTRGHPSHATVEVHTLKGWLMVDSIVPWMALDKQGNPVAASGIWNHLERFSTTPPEHLVLSSWALRGLYSRNGRLYGAAFPVPELNWIDFGHWLVTPDPSRHLY